MDVFEQCRNVNELLNVGDEPAARNELIRLLATLDSEGRDYSPLINCLIRQVGLFPYMDTTTAMWNDRYVCEVFKVDVGEPSPVTLHREQSRLLAELLAGKSIAVSAPTSFGKSFVIDSFIATRRPSIVVILVPTLALMDETRRRLQRKFGAEYKIITTPEQALPDQSILICPQERVLGYLRSITHIDILIVDEFYKASVSFDKDRAPALMRAIAYLGGIAKQRYFLAPNIAVLRESVFTEGMDFLKLDFNTVFLETTELFRDIGRDESRKAEALIRILNANDGKSLIYAGTYTNVSKVSTLLMDTRKPLDRPLLNAFQTWLARNYDPNWELTKLVSRGVGIHTGQLHRSLSQIQIRLFEEDNGLDQLVSTSSIIEGVNTSAQNVILWSNKNGRARINDFTYKNIIGRGGRMFRHFIGKIFVLEEPPIESAIQLELVLPDDAAGTFGPAAGALEYTAEQLKAIHAFHDEIEQIVGKRFQGSDWETTVFQSSDTHLITRIVRDLKTNASSWNGLRYLNSLDVASWERLLYRLINLQPGVWEIQYSRYVAFVKVLAGNWRHTIPELLEELSEHDIGINEFFKLERNTTFRLTSLLSDVAGIYNLINPNEPVDLSIAMSRLSNAFLPPLVYQLEEYGIPRMLSRKIHLAGLMNLEASDSDIHGVLSAFRSITPEALRRQVGNLDEFDAYILEYFYQGIGGQRLTSSQF